MLHKEQQVIRIIHFVQDDKFFYPVKVHFDEDRRLYNRYVLVCNNKEDLHFINNQDVICFGTEKEAELFVKSSQYDVLFFHSLPVETWKIVLAAPMDKIVIWWSWGYDIYNPTFCIKPILRIDLLKSETKRLFSHRHNPILKIIKSSSDLFQSLPYFFIKKRLLKRIDFFMPVIGSEYQLLKLQKISAKEFYYMDSIAPPLEVSKHRRAEGDLLCGNSATYTNNHFDLIRYLDKGNLCERVIHLPLSYGIESYSEELKNHFIVKDARIDFMDYLLPRDEYFKFLDSCSYFVCGCIRQQAMGNIYYCLNNHIKVFLFKDSLIYKYLKESGYVVFEIEKINSDSFTTPLTDSEMQQNIEAYKKDYERRNYIYEKCISEIQKNLN